MTSVVRRQEHDDSGEYSDASQDIELNNSGNDGGQHESDYDSQGSESDHSERDPDNQEAERRVDDDEDRSNPQYIPKRGTFYEHDDRTAASGEESSNTTSETASEKKEGSEAGTERRRPPRKSDIINKWSHDKYNENEQMPKSRDELVAIYGYDIRNEDAPPHARRNRRYGRGPNKYTRTWEDEEAYRRQNAIQAQPRKPPNPEDFPELDATKKYSKKTRAPRPRSKSQPASNESSENGSTLRRNASIKTAKPKPREERPKPVERTQRIVSKPVSSPKPQAKEKMPAIENLTITASVFNNSQGQPQRKVNAAVAQQRPVPTDQGKKKPMPTQQPQPLNNAAPNKSPPLQQAPQPQQKPQTQQNNTQASGAESRGGSKRYSSLRQRPLAEAYSPQQQQQTQQQPQQQQPQQQQIRYNEYPAGKQPQPASQHQGSPVPQIHPQQLIHPVHRTTHGPSPPHQQLPQQQISQQQIPQQQISQPQLPQQPLPQQQLPQQHSQQVRLGILEQQQLVSHPHHSLHNIPQPHTMGQIPPGQGYAPPAMMPAQYMQPAAQSGSGGVFGGAMFAQPPAPYPHQMYTPHHNYATQAGGVTYYSCAEQEQLPRPQRRPTAAIPIVRPAAHDRPANSTEKDNIDRIVENMFVRKPWPATHGDSKEKQSDNRSSQEPQSKEASISDSLTSSSISTDSKPSESKEDKFEELKEDDRKPEKETKESEPVTNQESIGTDA